MIQCSNMSAKFKLSCIDFTLLHYKYVLVSVKFGRDCFQMSYVKEYIYDFLKHLPIFSGVVNILPI